LTRRGARIEEWLVHQFDEDAAGFSPLSQPPVPILYSPTRKALRAGSAKTASAVVAQMVATPAVLLRHPSKPGSATPYISQGSTKIYRKI
jgi:hypothetical protein